ncbi:MerR family transcriptional regulator [Pseudooctadecabacter sp.]|uniref:MerR family transcriptional regulator n=1 Tax=Pseudooctadecabacter sp. TaxID=1966338 RepID=UPI003F6CB980
MSKSRDAFRTISEVSEALDVPAHVLRFWESKFAQVKPVKRAGGRRYYRPADVDLLAGIKKLLHEDGMTIKGAQKLLREQGVKSVSAVGAALLPGNTVDAAPEPTPPEATVPADPAPTEPEATVEITNVVPLPPKADGPALTLDLSAKDTSAETPAAADAAPVETVAAEAPPVDATPVADAAATSDVAPSVPADPSDSDSKAPARLFHLLRDAPHDRIAAKAQTIAPLLERMRDLRGRIETR